MKVRIIEGPGWFRLAKEVVEQLKVLNTNLAGICSHLGDIHKALIEDEGLVSELRVTNDRLSDLKESVEKVEINADVELPDVAEEIRRWRFDGTWQRSGT